MQLCTRARAYDRSFHCKVHSRTCARSSESSSSKDEDVSIRVLSSSDLAPGQVVLHLLQVSLATSFKLYCLSTRIVAFYRESIYLLFSNLFSHKKHKKRILPRFTRFIIIRSKDDFVVMFQMFIY